MYIGIIYNKISAMIKKMHENIEHINAPVSNSFFSLSLSILTPYAKLTPNPEINAPNIPNC